MNKKTRKILLGTMSLALIAVMAIAGTFAYLQDTSEDVVNTFNPNAVEVDLIEHDKDGETSTGNDYSIVPGTEATKDPQVKADVTLPSYVYVEITDVVNAQGQKLVEYTVDTKWTKLDGCDNVWYREVAESDTDYVPVLTDNKITYPAALTNEDLELLTDKNNTLSFKAFAIQKIPFNDPFKAYFQADEVVTLGSGEDEEGVEAINQKIAEAEGSLAVIVKEDFESSKSIVVPEGKTVVLSMEEGATLTNEENHAVEVKDGGALTVKGGAIDATAHAKAAVYNNNGTVLLDGVKLTRSEEAGASATNNGGNSYYVILNHGTMTLNNCEVEANGSYSSLIENGWQNGSQNTAGEDSVLTINGGTYVGGLNTIKNDDYGVLTINGGTFTNKAQYAVQNWNVAVINGGSFTSSESSVIYNGKTDDTMDKGELTITGGSFQYPEDYFGIYNDKNYEGTVKITGGEFATEYICNTSYTTK